MFQVFDVLFSGLLKSSKKFQMRDDGLDALVDHILRLFRADKAISANATRRPVWRKAGFEYENWNMTTYLNVNERPNRESPDFRRIRPFDYQESRSSTRRQKKEWERTSENMFHKKERTVLKT
jgi:hypothetical protein